MSIFLDPFGEIFIWVIFKNDSEGSTNPHFKFKMKFKYDAQMAS